MKIVKNKIIRVLVNSGVLKTESFGLYGFRIFVFLTVFRGVRVQGPDFYIK